MDGGRKERVKVAVLAGLRDEEVEGPAGGG